MNVFFCYTKLVLFLFPAGLQATLSSPSIIIIIILLATNYGGFTMCHMQC